MELVLRGLTWDVVLAFLDDILVLGQDFSHHIKNLENVFKLRDWPVPRNSKEVERFAGLANYHRSCFKDFTKLATPLYSITGKKSFKWEGEQQVAFYTIKNALISALVLALPNRVDPFILDTDASNLAIGAELLQVQDNDESDHIWESV
ncbi:uncharacterized protein LOC144353210 [Saccoglossus kowalevskii]